MEENMTQVQADTAPKPPARTEKQRFSDFLYRSFGGILIYEGIMYAVVIAYVFCAMIYELVSSSLNSSKFDTLEFTERMTSSGMSMILGVGAATIFMILFSLKRITIPQIFQKRKSMDGKSFLVLLFLLFGIQLPFIFFSEFAEFLINKIGFSIQDGIDASSGTFDTPSMIIYISFVAPIVEELIFRGFMMQTFERANIGRGYAVVISAVLFGALHANLTQSIYAFFAGIVFAYAAMEFGIVWSMVLHIMNNFLLGAGLALAEKKLPEDIVNYLSYGLLGIFFVGAVIAAIIKRKAIGRRIKELFAVEKRFYGWTFSNPLLIIFLLLNLVFALVTIKKI